MMEPLGTAWSRTQVGPEWRMDLNPSLQNFCPLSQAPALYLTKALATAIPSLILQVYR